MSLFDWLVLLTLAGAAIWFLAETFGGGDGTGYGT